MMQMGLCPSFHGPSSKMIVFGDAMLRARDVAPTGTRIFSDVETPPGDWILNWEGAGTASLDAKAEKIDSGSGFVVYRFERTEKPVFVKWAGEVENLKVWLPQHQGKLFWTPFVILLRNMRPKSLRTLDWTRTNEGLRERDPSSQWVVSPENQVALCNAVGCGLHYPVPINAPETYLRWVFQALTALKGELKIEVGNELWNPSFIAWKWLDDKAGRHVDAAAREIDRVFAIAAQELPAARTYVGGHLANPWYLRTLLGLVKSRVDACGPATYIGPKETPATAEACALACLARVEEIRPLVKEHREIATQRGASFELYEAGQSFRNGGPVVAAAQYTDTMADAYRKLAAMLEEEKVDRVNWYSLATSQTETNTAPFGLLDRMRPPWPAKADAVIEMMRQA